MSKSRVIDMKCPHCGRIDLDLDLTEQESNDYRCGNCQSKMFVFFANFDLTTNMCIPHDFGHGVFSHALGRDVEKSERTGLYKEQGLIYGSDKEIDAECDKNKKQLEAKADIERVKKIDGMVVDSIKKGKLSFDN